MRCWHKGIVRNHSINLLGKKRIEEVPLYDDSLFIEGIDLDELIISGDREAVLIELIRALDPTMREIIEYKYILDYSNKEIAVELNISQSAVSSRLDRAKKVLRSKLEEAGGEIVYE
jgi:RNA polymerase sigma factor, sigma-70 family